MVDAVPGIVSRGHCLSQESISKSQIWYNLRNAPACQQWDLMIKFDQGSMAQSSGRTSLLQWSRSYLCCSRGVLAWQRRNYFSGEFCGKALICGGDGQNICGGDCQNILEVLNENVEISEVAFYLKQRFYSSHAPCFGDYRTVNQTQVESSSPKTEGSLV